MTKLRTLFRRNGSTVGFALFVVIHTILSGRVWWWNVFLVIPPNFFLLAFILFLLIALLRRYWISLAILLLSFPLVWMNGDVVLSHGSATEPQPGDATVFSWNTEFWETRDPDAFYAFIRSQNADIILLQEHMNQADEPLLNDLPEIQSRFPGYEMLVDGELVTLTKYPIEHYVRGDKFLRTDLRIHDRSVSVYNVHLSNPVNPDIIGQPAKFLASMRRYFGQRAAQFAALESDLTANPLPRFVAGDFNTTRSMGSLRWFFDHFDDGARAGDYSFPATWNDRWIKLWRIDQVFHDERVTVRDYRIIDTGNFSDHAGVTVHLSLE